MKRVVWGVAVGIMGILLMSFSFSRGIPVFEKDLPPDEFALYEEIPEYHLVVDATFGGVFRSLLTDRLVSAYDRSRPRERAACPT